MKRVKYVEINSETLDFIKQMTVNKSQLLSLINMSTSAYYRNIALGKMQPIETVNDVINFLETKTIDTL